MEKMKNGLELQKLTKQFDEKFENTFGLSKKGYNKKYIEFARVAMSNLIGGTG